MENTNFYFPLEAVLLTLAAITILSIDFSRFVVLMVLLAPFVLLFWQTKANFLLIALSVLFVFIVMLNPFVIAAILFGVVYGLLIAYPYMYKENEAVVFDVEEDTKIRQEKLDGLVIYNIFQSKVEGIEI